MSFRIHPGPPRRVECTTCRRSGEVRSELQERNWKRDHVCTSRAKALADQ